MISAVARARGISNFVGLYYLFGNYETSNTDYLFGSIVVYTRLGDN